MNTKTTASSNQKEASDRSTQGGSHEQHVKAGQQSHKNTSSIDKHSSVTNQGSNQGSDQNRNRS